MVDEPVRDDELAGTSLTIFEKCMLDSIANMQAMLTIQRDIGNLQNMFNLGLSISVLALAAFSFGLSTPDANLASTIRWGGMAGVCLGALVMVYSLIERQRYRNRIMRVVKKA